MLELVRVNLFVIKNVNLIRLLLEVFVGDKFGIFWLGGWALVVGYRSFIVYSNGVGI